jgi:hypothetical protein
MSLRAASKYSVNQRAKVSRFSGKTESKKDPSDV